jgi:prepilin-type N-terminal cleavage/methylation domain-containing protein
MKATKEQGKSRSGSEGFTLIEAIIVLVIIGVLGMVSVPAVMNTLSLMKLQRASDAFVNQAMFARVQAAARHRAYEMRVILSDGVNSGAIVLNEGISAACTQAISIDGSVQPSFEKNGQDPEPILGVKSVDFLKAHELVVIESVEPAELASTALCFKPDGRVLREDTGSPVTPAPEGYAAGEAVYTLRLMTGEGQPTQQVRRVIIPYNGIPKVQ